ncbi:MAG: DUF3568 family protein [Deltaproteobacteria bacterium]|nr:DUF3568 family protein [Deltaproteobacteria bacterium]
MKPMIRVKCVCLAVLLFFSSGCGAVIVAGAGAAAGIAGYKYYKGALTVVYKAPFKKTWDASLTALRQMDCKIERSKHDITAGTIWGKFSDDKVVSISLTYKSANETEAVIRVGAFGEKEASLIVKEKIEKVLSEGT